MGRDKLTNVMRNTVYMGVRDLSRRSGYCDGAYLSFVSRLGLSHGAAGFPMLGFNSDPPKPEQIASAILQANNEQEFEFDGENLFRLPRGARGAALDVDKLRMLAKDMGASQQEVQDMLPDDVGRGTNLLQSVKLFVIQGKGVNTTAALKRIRAHIERAHSQGMFLLPTISLISRPSESMGRKWCDGLHPRYSLACIFTGVIRNEKGDEIRCNDDLLVVTMLPENNRPVAEFIVLRDQGPIRMKTLNLMASGDWYDKYLVTYYSALSVASMAMTFWMRRWAQRYGPPVKTSTSSRQHERSGTLAEQCKVEVSKAAEKLQRKPSTRLTPAEERALQTVCHMSSVEPSSIDNPDMRLFNIVVAYNELLAESSDQDFDERKKILDNYIRRYVEALQNDGSYAPQAEYNLRAEAGFAMAKITTPKNGNELRPQVQDVFTQILQLNQAAQKNDALIMCLLYVYTVGCYQMLEYESNERAPDLSSIYEHTNHSLETVVFNLLLPIIPKETPLMKAADSVQEQILRGKDLGLKFKPYEIVEALKASGVPGFLNAERGTIMSSDDIKTIQSVRSAQSARASIVPTPDRVRMWAVDPNWSTAYDAKSPLPDGSTFGKLFGGIGVPTLSMKATYSEMKNADHLFPLDALRFSNFSLSDIAYTATKGDAGTRDSISIQCDTQVYTVDPKQGVLIVTQGKDPVARYLLAFTGVPAGETPAGEKPQGIPYLLPFGPTNQYDGDEIKDRLEMRQFAFTCATALGGSNDSCIPRMNVEANYAISVLGKRLATGDVGTKMQMQIGSVTVFADGEILGTDGKHQRRVEQIDSPTVLEPFQCEPQASPAAQFAVPRARGGRGVPRGLPSDSPATSFQATPGVPQGLPEGLPPPVPQGMPQVFPPSAGHHPTNQTSTPSIAAPQPTQTPRSIGVNVSQPLVSLQY